MMYCSRFPRDNTPRRSVIYIGSLQVFRSKYGFKKTMDYFYLSGHALHTSAFAVIADSWEQECFDLLSNAALTDKIYIFNLLILSRHLRLFHQLLLSALTMIMVVCIQHCSFQQIMNNFLNLFRSANDFYECNVGIHEKTLPA